MTAEAPETRRLTPVAATGAVAPTVPAPPDRRVRLVRAVETFGDLFFIQFSSVRSGWQWIFVVSSVLPLGILVFLSFVAGHASHQTMLYYITGNVVVALMLNPLFMLSGQLAWAKQTKAFDFYAGLPISRTALILAALGVAVMFTIPGMILLMILGMLFYHLWLVPSLLILPVMVLAPLALCGIGALIGVLAPNQQVAGVTANLMMVAVMFLSPVYAPLSKLPRVLQLTSQALPPTYAAEALRETLSRQITGRLWLDLAVMVGFSAMSIYLVTERLDWRSR